MYILLRKVDALAPDYSYCYKYSTLEEAQQKYQELLADYSPRCLKLIETTSTQLALIVHGDGDIEVSPLEFPLASQVSPGIIQLATALEASYDNPQDYVEGIPVSVSPTLIKEMIDAGLATAGFVDATTTRKGVVRLATEEEADYDNPSNGEDNVAVMQPIVTKGMIDTAAEYTTTYSQNVTNIKEALNDIYNQINYVPLAITSFTTFQDKYEYEIGDTPTITCSWSYNKRITTQSLDGIALAFSVDTYSLQNITDTHDIVLTASDGVSTTSKSLRVIFTNQIYYGAAAIPSTIDSAWVRLLGSKLTPTYKGTYHFNCGSALYAFLAIPKSYNPPSVCYINSWMTDLVLVDEIDFESNYGIISKYKIYRTTNPGLGSFDMELK